MSLALLMAIAFAAFFVEAAAGFGATVLAVALGAQVVPVEAMLPLIVPANIVLSAAIALRHWRAIAWSLLVRRILPFLALGIPFGLLAFNARDSAALRLAFGCFVVLLAAVEAVRALAPATRPGNAQGVLHLARAVVLAVGGFAHGLFGTGGPFVVFVASRDLADRHAFRATLAALWLTLNAVLIVDYAAVGALTPATLRDSFALLVPLGLAFLAAEALHRRLRDRPFRLAVAAVLFIAGGVLVAKGLP